VLNVIAEASSPSDYETFGTLIREYVQWCRTRCADHPWLVDMAFSHQSLDQELRELATSYAPPCGNVLIARCDGQASGAVAYRTLAPGICEMKRLFVTDRFKRAGTGRRLCEALVTQAKAAGFSLLRLDTCTLFHEAIALYRALGFVECAPYHQPPSDLMPFLVFMERPLFK
jgi:GNAT superfamily N-acetyltransferase